MLASHNFGTEELKRAQNQPPGCKEGIGEFYMVEAVISTVSFLLLKFNCIAASGIIQRV